MKTKLTAIEQVTSQRMCVCAVPCIEWFRYDKMLINWRSDIESSYRQLFEYAHSQHIAQVQNENKNNHIFTMRRWIDLNIMKS